MRAAFLLALLAGAANAQQSIELERMTWVEIEDALRQGKTTALVFNGGTEQRGPHAATGGHTLVAAYTALEIAKRLGNALVAPILPFSPNRADPGLPGTIGLSPATFTSLNVEIAEQLLANGFKNVVLMGDHGGGQRELQTVAATLDAKYKLRGLHVFYCGDVYAKANRQIAAWLEKNGYPPSTHGGIPDTSQMLYVGGDSGYVRKDLLATAVEAKSGRNGISGDARRSTAELGKRFLNMKVDLAVAQIQALIGHRQR